MKTGFNKGAARAALVAASLAFGLGLGAAWADEDEHEDHDEGVVAFEIPANPTRAFKLMIGAEVYDNWWETVGTEAPEGTHPAYPAAGKKKGATTWRCKECHGWDYKGAAGAYGSGSHFTGIKGIDGMKGADPAKIEELLRGPTHGFTEEMIPDVAMDYLALFVSEGQEDPGAIIDAATKKVAGDAERGAASYQTVCAKCHGPDGKWINFGSEDDPEYVGTVASGNPWEGLHKVKYGQPGGEMPALLTFDAQAIADILAYAQTLPAK